MTPEELENYQTLSSVGDANAIHQLVDLYMEIGDYEKAFLNAQRFEYVNDKDGYRKLGYFYECGIGTTVNIEKAKQFYRKAYELDDYIAGYNLALIYQKEGNYSECVIYLCLAKLNDHIPSIKLLASMYYKGQGVDKNIDVALNLYKQAYDLGDHKCSGKIGIILYQQQNYFDAINFLKESVNYNDYDAMYLLGVCYEKGLGLATNIEEAIALYEKGSEARHKKCTFILAQHYLKGIGVEKDVEKANSLLATIEK